MDEEMQRLLQQAQELGIDTSEIEKSDTDYGSPEPEKKDSNLKLFRDMITGKPSHKFSNLDITELGKVFLGVRHYLDIGAYARVEGLDDVALYLENKAEIIAATAMSKKGWFGNLIVTQIKKEQKIGLQQPAKKGWFSKNEKQEVGQSGTE